MSDADRVGLAFVVESNFGVLEPGNPDLQDLRFTSESLKQDTSSVTSQQITSDRQIVDLIRTGLGASGDINFELSYGSHDTFLEAALLSATWGSIVTTTKTDLSMANSDNSINTAAGDFVADGFLINQWVHITGFTGETANNALYKIVSVATLKIVLTGAAAVVDDAAGESVTIEQGSLIKNGTTVRSFSIEKVFADVANEFVGYAGMNIDTFALNIASDQILTGTFGFLGKNAISATSTIGDGANSAVSTTVVMNAVDDVKGFVEGNALFSITAASITLANNLRSRLQVATLGPISIGTGTCNVTGTVQAYFTSKAIMDKYLNFTKTSLAIKVLDTAGNAYVIDMPSVKFSSGQRVAGGNNQDIIADLAFQAYKDATEGYTIRIQRFAA